jgi:UDP-GlcNAc:undecaprenyl-phosphate/decaprenyl-phosphate GlcNAc-1-phosphate transferase
VSRRIAVLGGALAASVVATRAAAATARKLGVVDHPGPLKPQAAPVPYLGGIGVLAGSAVGLASTRPVQLIPLGLATALGTMDDCMNLSPKARVLGQIGIGIISAATVKTKFPAPVNAALVTGSVFVLMNGMNLVDGLDGLAGGVATASGCALAALLSDDARLQAEALALGCVGFLTLNRPPASVYLGDGGAYLIGTSLALLLASAWKRESRTQTNLASLLVVALPAAEITFAIVRRRKGSQSVVEGDRGHPYDRLVDRGWSTRAAAATYVATEAALGLLAVTVAKRKSIAVPLAAVGAVAAAMIGAAKVAGVLEPKSEN